MNVERQSKVVDTITQQIRVGEQNLQIAQNLMQRTQQLYAERSNDSILYWLTSDYDSQIEGQFPDDKETLKLKLDAAKDAFSRAERQIEGLRMQLSSEMSALQTALDKYTDKVKEQFDNKTSILQLRAHIKDNILYYMQAIWRYEQPDQRFFRIYNIKVPLFISSVPNTTVEIYGMVNTVADTVIGMAGELNVRKFPCGTIIPPPQIWENFVSLVEIADIDTLLGFKGNYMIFPLKPNYNNPLIDFMIQDYVVVDDILRANDPDDVGNYDTDELVELIKCIYKKNPADFTDDLRDQFKELLIRRLTSTNLEKELIIIPTGSLYIDSIPGEKPNLEIYKLLSRAEDVKKAQANVRQEELKNILRVVRILKGQLEEQTVDKKIVVEGDSDIHIDPNS